MREPTRIGSVVMATLRDRPEWGRVSWTRIGPAEPDDSTDPDYTPWVLTSDIESGHYFHRNNRDVTAGVGHSSWDQFNDDAKLSGAEGDALAEIMQSGGVDGAHHKQWTLDQVVRILTECPRVLTSARDADGGTYWFEALGESEDYLDWVNEWEGDPADPENYYGEWDRGIAP